MEKATNVIIEICKLYAKK